MSRHSDLGITSTSAFHSQHVGTSSDDCESDIGDGYDDDDNDAHSKDSDDSRRSYDNNECDYLRNR
eukprot:CAMPEP_0171007188 /NCGR_PEP_ID=MMETSP0736-20130129/19632_1 /TAXON_ID=186038 /ORGANISM="Fragilariopsis kerguelensis, Strain L26-C5" /LENGTH=65 /DNA_ID=CAMNT_0011437673 /DNA_START=411 /DNA_END=604 /DNA_ORIENTATION=+